MAQQTAVEWLIDRYISSNEPLKYYHLEHAKEMEKQQIESAWKRGDGVHDEVADKLAKQYYTETYTNE